MASSALPLSTAEYIKSLCPAIICVSSCCLNWNENQETDLQQILNDVSRAHNMAASDILYQLKPLCCGSVVGLAWCKVVCEHLLIY